MKSNLQLNTLIVSGVLRLILLSYPALLYLIRGGMSGAMFVLLVLSLLLLAAGCRQREPFGGVEIAFGVSMASGLVAIFVAQLYWHDLSARHFDSASRFLLAVPIFYALRYVDGSRIASALQYAFPLGAIAALIAVEHPLATHEASTSFMNHIHLGDTAILLGFLSLFSINWVGKDGWAAKGLKIGGLVAGMTVSILSQSRGSWAAMPIFAAAFIYFYFRGENNKKLALVIAMVGLVSLMSYIFIDPIQLRIGMIFSDLSRFYSGDAETSIGVRLQLWHAAMQLIAENPIFGVGADGFAKAMGPLSEVGQITPIAAVFGRGEVHNEILAQTVRFGILGLCFALSVYFVPLYFFMRLVKSANQNQAVTSMMGVCVTAGFFIFGLTVETFNLKMTASFYCTTVAVLLAAATSRNDGG